MARDLRVDAYKEWQIGLGRLNDGQEEVAAFTVAELGEMLPKNTMEYYPSVLSSDGNDKIEWFSIWYLDGGDVGKTIKADTEADARAAMLIYLIENKLVTV